MKYKKSIVSFAVLSVTTAASSAAALTDGFDIPPYMAGDIVGQSGPVTPDGPWAPGAWTKTGPAEITGEVGSSALNIGKTIESNLGTFNRVYSTTELSAPYSIAFSVTINNLNAILAGGAESPTSPAAGDYLNIYDRPGANNDFGASGTWLIRGSQLNSTGASVTNGGGTTTNQTAYDPAAPLNWYAYDYTALANSGFNTANVVDTGIALAVGNTYDFTVNFLGEGQWSLGLTDGTSSFTSEAMGFRSNVVLPSADVHFGLSDRGIQPDAAGEDLSFSVNSFSVVPEPASAMLFAIGALGLLRRRR